MFRAAEFAGAPRCIGVCDDRDESSASSDPSTVAVRPTPAGGYTEMIATNLPLAACGKLTHRLPQLRRTKEGTDDLDEPPSI